MLILEHTYYKEVRSFKFLTSLILLDYMHPKVSKNPVEVIRLYLFYFDDIFLFL
jgi:hypothetical protein